MNYLEGLKELHKKSPFTRDELLMLVVDTIMEHSGHNLMQAGLTLVKVTSEDQELSSKVAVYLIENLQVETRRKFYGIVTLFVDHHFFPSFITSETVTSLARN